MASEKRDLSSLMRIAKIVVVGCVCAAPAGCDSVRLFRGYEFQESASVESTPYPRLVDTPDAPAVGTYTQEVPDPANGVATVVELQSRGAGANAMRAELGEPVIDDATRKRLMRARARAKRR